MESIWEATAALPQFASLAGDTKTDVLIIGGGIAGLLLAWELDRRGVDYLLVERNRICSGTTKHTTAKLTLQHGAIYDALMRKSYALAEQYYAANEDALRCYRKLCAAIECDWEEKDNYLYSIDDEDVLVDELSALRRLGAEADWCASAALPLDTVGAVRLAGQAQFHPLKFAAAIAKGRNIREQTWVRELIGTTAVTDTGRIRAKRIAVMTHFPFWNKHGLYFLKLYQSRSYLLALEDAAPVDGMFMDEDRTGFSFRTYRNLLLLGGGAHRTGKTGGGFAAVRDLAASVYPHALERYAWAAQDCMSLDGVPYIGTYAKGTKGFYVASGFNKWGFLGAMAAARILAGELTDGAPDWAEAFDPNRSLWKPQLVVNGFEAATGLITPAEKRCPHLGCALRRNAEEHSWDCACHGSRFSADGTLLDNPANGDLPGTPAAES